jgi:SAM-dependent methyltransferase
MSVRRSKEEHLRMNQAAWDASHRGWFEANTAPDWYDRIREGEVDISDLEIELMGGISGLDVLQLSCAGDADQAFSLANLGARVTACDFSPVAIEIAKENAQKVGLDVHFVVDDSQRLDTIDDNQFDFIWADYNLWYYEDLGTACKNWHRVLRSEGRLLLHEEHPITTWCLERDDATDSWKVKQSYDDDTPEYYRGEESSIFSLGNPDLEAVEFPHTMADILNAVFQSGLIAERLIENTRENTKGTARGLLPSDFFLIAHKPSVH